MSLQTAQHWQMDSHSHVFPPVPEVSGDLFKVLTLLKEYDEVCSEARAHMIQQINELLGNRTSKK
jgi:hypothetical protein